MKYPTDPRVHNGAIALAVLAVLLIPLKLTRADETRRSVPNMAGFPNPNGVVRTFNQNGDIDLSGVFFQSLGTNGRSCGSCHQPSDAMSVSAADIQQRFDQSDGLDPIFRTVDGSNCDQNIDVSTVAGRSAAYSLLRTRGLIRIALALPITRDFDVMSVSNPFGCGDTGTLSMYRRPLPSTNVRFLSTVMFDGRESATQTGTTPILFSNFPQSLISDLDHQSVDATLTHAQGIMPGLTSAQQQAIVSFEMGLFSAQAEDQGAGELTAQGALGGPNSLSQQGFYIGTNDPVGLDPNNPVPFAFNTNIFNLYDAWQNSPDPHRQSIARGQTLFNTRTFIITGVGGLNGATFTNGVVGPATIVSTCGICHDTPNVGDHSVSAPLNIGVADPPGGRNVLDTSYLPAITICQRPSLSTCITTTDPGRAMVTGKYADVAKFKGPILRGLSARAPYFHNGSAQTLTDVVRFYNSRFQIGFTDQEMADLVAFLAAL